MASLAAVLELLTSPKPCAVGSVACAVLVFVLTCIWASTYLQCNYDDPKAFSWDETKYQGCVFNWHPVLMTLSMIVLPTCAVVSYQLPFPKAVTKPIHFSLLTAALVLMCVGLHAAFKYHDTKMFKGKPSPIANMESFHSHIGIFTAVLFAAQYVVGAYHFIPGPDSKLPGVSAASKAMYLPIHVTAGLLMVTLPVITVATGIQEKTEFQDRFGMHSGKEDCVVHGKGDPGCHKLAPGSDRFNALHAKELVLLNWVSGFLVLQLILLVFAVRRRKKPEPASADPLATMGQTLLQ